jgi:hypothetical protein
MCRAPSPSPGLSRAPASSPCRQVLAFAGVFALEVLWSLRFVRRVRLARAKSLARRATNGSLEGTKFSAANPIANGSLEGTNFTGANPMARVILGRHGGVAPPPPPPPPPSRGLLTPALSPPPPQPSHAHAASLLVGYSSASTQQPLPARRRGTQVVGVVSEWGHGRDHEEGHQQDPFVPWPSTVTTVDGSDAPPSRSSSVTVGAAPPAVPPPPPPPPAGATPAAAIPPLEARADSRVYSVQRMLGGVSHAVAWPQDSKATPVSSPVSDVGSAGTA